ncbi:MAG: 4'-phosphopantetheinyl transferase superfamily protein [Prevotella sp.]|nr:4'-phosphopantetheinyl transferase superfamily protein [Prevotella sp.]
MALINIRQIDDRAQLGLWRMEEDAYEKPRLRERKAVARLLEAMTGNAALTIQHESSGKPFLDNGQTISISHTQGYAALLLADSGRLGIDIERRSDRVERIASRFIRPDEKAETTSEKLLIWSAKEALYKYFSEDNLLFYDMRTLAVAENMLQMENLKRDVVVDVHYEFSPDYVLTYIL